MMAELIAPLPDSAGAIAKAMGGHLLHFGTFAEYVDSWHEFFLLAGTAAVTLVGLLFVALSLHLDQLVEDSHAHLLGLARVTLGTYTMIMTLSLMMLAPAFSPRITGVMLIAVAVVSAAFTLRTVVRNEHHEEGGFTRKNLRRRLRLPIVGYAMTAVSGLGVLLGVPELMNWMLGVICMLLGNAVGTSWELLIHVARHKRKVAGRS